MADRPHVVWHELMDDYQVFYSAWKNQEWSESIALSQPGRRGWFPAITSDSDNNIHAVWTSGAHGEPSEIFYRKLTGKKWSAPLNISGSATDSLWPTIAAEDTNVYAAWASNDVIGGYNWRVFYSKWDGSSWSHPELVSEDIVSSIAPYIAVKSGIVYILWSGTAPGSPSDVFYRRLDASGWSPIINLTNTPTKSHVFGLAVDGEGRAHVTWEDETDPSTGFIEVYYRSISSNLDLSPVVKLSDSSWASHSPRVATDRIGNLYFVWETHGQILYQNWDTNGWGPVIMVSSPSIGGGYPDITCNPKGYSQIVWEDYQPGNIEVVYTKLTK